MDLASRKAGRPFDDWNAVVGSCLTGQLVGDQGEKVKGQSSVGRKVPSSRAVLDERGGVGLGSILPLVDQKAEGEVTGCKLVIVLWNVVRRLQDCLRIAEPMGQPVALG